MIATMIATIIAMILPKMPQDPKTQESGIGDQAINSGKAGAPGGIRTRYPRFRRPMLCPDELRALLVRHYNNSEPTPSYPLPGGRPREGRIELPKNHGQEPWSGQEDLNLRPPAPKAGALPDCAMPRSVGDSLLYVALITWRMGIHGHEAAL